MKVAESHSTDAKVSFYSKKNSTRSVFLEGFANRFKEDGKLLIDRGNDLIQPAAWDLKNFTSNGIILFNHDRDNPVGRAVKIEKNDDGLFVKAKLSDSSHPEISRVRDLVKDGVLKAFSVGFDPKSSDEEEIEGKKVNMIKEAELLEISIVSLPMAERSLFNVTAKTLAELPYSVAKKACSGEFNVYEDDGMTFTTEVSDLVSNNKDASAAKAEDTPPEATEDQPAPSEAAEIIDSQPKEAPTSALLDQIKQTNILLSSLIGEVKLMSQKLDKVEEVKVEEEEEEEEEEEVVEQQAPASPAKEEEEEEEEAEEEEESKKLKLVDDIHAHCDRILRKYGY